MTNDVQDQGAGQPAGGLAGMLAGISWPMVATLALGLALLLVGPRLGVDVDKALPVLAGLLAAGGYQHSRTAARQTNGALDERMRAAVARGIAEALDGQPPAAQPARPAPADGTAWYPPQYGDRG